MVTLAFLATLLESPATPVQDKTPYPASDSYVGCYSLTLSSWRPAMDLRGDITFATPPATIELTGTEGGLGLEKGYLLVKPAPGFKPSIHDFAHWRLTPNQRIEIVWTTGFSGLRMDLTPQAWGLIGKAHTFWDVPGSIQWANVRAERTPCQRTTAPTKR
jgi:hypothetical protein